MNQSLIQQMIDAYMQAELDVLAGKSVVLNGKTLTTEDLAEIRAGRQEWERRLIQGNRPRGPKLARFG